MTEGDWLRSRTMSQKIYVDIDVTNIDIDAIDNILEHMHCTNVDIDVMSEELG